MKSFILFIVLIGLGSCGKHEISRPDFTNSEVTDGEEALSPSESALLELQSGNSDAFIQIVTSEALALNQILKNGNTFLIEAVLWQRVEIVEWLVAKEEIDLEAKDNQGLTASDHARIVGNPQIIKLVSSGKLSQEEINASLMSALYAKDMDAVKEAVNSGAELNIFDEKGLTPLIIAIYLKEEGLIRYLLQTRKVDVNLPDQRRRWSPLKWSKQQKLTRVEQMLLRLGAQE